MVKVSALRAADPRFDSHLCHGDFAGLSHTNDLKGIGWPSILLLGEVESLIPNFYLSVAACMIV